MPRGTLANLDHERFFLVVQAIVQSQACGGSFPVSCKVACSSCPWPWFFLFSCIIILIYLYAILYVCHVPVQFKIFSMKMPFKGFSISLSSELYHRHFAKYHAIFTIGILLRNGLRYSYGPWCEGRYSRSISVSDRNWNYDTASYL